MPERKQLVQNSVTGYRGTDNRNHPTELQDGYAADLTNVDIQTLGKAQSRPGYTLIANNDGTTKRVLGLSDFNPEGGTHKLIRVKGQAIQYWLGSGSWTTVTSPFTDDLVNDIVIAKNIAYFLNGTDNVRSYDGTTVTDEGNNGTTNPPKSTHGEWMINRLFLAGNSTNPSIVYFSDSLAPSTFNQATNRLSINVGDNYPVNGLKKFRQYVLLVFKTRGIFAVDVSNATPGNWTIDPVDTEFGCIAKRTIVQVGNDIWFLANDLHVRSVLRSQLDKVMGASLPITYEVQAWIDRINPSAVANASAAYFANKYWLFVPMDSATRNTHAIVYDFVQKGWSLWTNHNILSAATSTIQQSNTVRLYGGESQNTALVYRLFNGASDNGTAIAYSVETKRENFDTPLLDKSWQMLELEMIASSGTASVSGQVDGAGYSMIGTMDLSGNLPQLPIALPFNLVPFGLAKKKFNLDNVLSRGRNVQYQITYSSATDTVQLKRVTTAAFQEALDMEH